MAGMPEMQEQFSGSAKEIHTMTIRHFLNTQDFSRAELDALLAQAAAFKRTRHGSDLAGRSIALLFFNPSLRTLASMPVPASWRQ